MWRFSRGLNRVLVIVKVHVYNFYWSLLSLKVSAQVYLRYFPLCFAGCLFLSWNFRHRLQMDERFFIAKSTSLGNVNRLIQSSCSLILNLKAKRVFLLLYSSSLNYFAHERVFLLWNSSILSTIRLRRALSQTFASVREWNFDFYLFLELIYFFRVFCCCWKYSNLSSLLFLRTAWFYIELTNFLKRMVLILCQVDILSLRENYLLH